MKRLPEPKHVPPERIWSFIYHQFELQPDEQRHLNVCVYCADVFKLCVTCDSLDCVLTELGLESSSDSAAA